jgi:N-acetylhexosamine 1-kinase
MKIIASQFQLIGEVISVAPYGEGHINDTYLVRTNEDQRYILQKINHRIFKHVDQLMSNVDLVTSHVKQEMKKLGLIIENHVLEVIPTRDNLSFYQNETGYYRVYAFVNHSIAYQKIPNAKILELAGEAFGGFQKMLDQFDARLLYETIIDFHHTEKRYQFFLEVLKTAPKDRLNDAKTWIDEVIKREKLVHLIVDAIKNNEIPLRTTHNDTKLNNILFHETTGEVLCIIDLDTLMPGSIPYDFGDAIRTGCNTAEEDEKDLSLVQFNQPYFEAFTKGFLSKLDGIMIEKEYELLPYGAILMTFEVGMRFLTDYLNMDTYFKIKYPQHNLVRAMNQLTLVSRMEESMDEMKQIIKRCRG